MSNKPDAREASESSGKNVAAAAAKKTAQESVGKTSAKRKSLQSGFSLLARGEPQIWFTGGMLVLCLAMIFGLVTLIVVSGVPTFWPSELNVIVLNDGTLEIGQPQKTQIRQDNSSSSDTANPKVALPSRYFRTANNDLTGRHFRWIDPNEANADGISQPDLAMVVERTSWGRLHGVPLELSEDLQLDASSADRQRELQQSLELVRVASDAESTELSDKVVAAIERLAQQERSDALGVQIADRQAVDDNQGQLQFQADGDAWQPASQLESSTTIANARLLFTEPSVLRSALQTAIGRATQLRHRAQELRVEISRLDARISRMRALVRRAELDTETNLAVQVDNAHGLLEMQEQLAIRAERLGTLTSNIAEAFAGDPDSLSLATEWLQRYKTEVLPANAAELQSQVEAWLAPVKAGPPELLAAVEDYQSQFRRIVREKLPLQSELANVEEELNIGQVNFAVPIGGVELADFTQADLDALAKQEVSPAMQERLKEIGIDAVAVSAFDTVSEHLTWIRLIDRQSEPHLLAVTRPGYIQKTESAPELKATWLTEKQHPCSEIVRAVAVNQLTLGEKSSVYLDRWREFLTENPRENTEGGVFPAIWGTVVMTLIMTIAVMPFGVMAALYLREYTKAGPLVSLIRISINNLAGVPSIVYGVFGFSFFCYLIGAFVDGGAKNADIAPLPPTGWFLALAATAITGTSAFMLSFFGSGPSHTQTNAKRWMSKIALFCWLVSIAAFAILILKSPFFGGFYREYLPNPTFGKGGLLWAALTLSLLTLPVVIVATEEALAAVPNSLREGSLACGASKWQTIRRIVLPHARPGILTGAILAMARGAGEVAPLMLVGALPSAPDLPLDGEFPYFHGSRSFMHLGYQIYTLGLQSPNSEAAKPMVFTCTLLLILIIATLNVSAIYLRARLRRRFQGNQF